MQTKAKSMVLKVSRFLLGIAAVAVMTGATQARAQGMCIDPNGGGSCGPGAQAVGCGGDQGMCIDPNG